MSNLIRSEAKFPCQDGFQMSAYVSRPATPDKVPGMVFIYEVFGMNAEMTRIADELAAEGYAVMLPDLFERGSWLGCVRRIFKDLKAGEGRSVQDLVAARRWLAEQNYVDADRIAVMGLCMGGGFALLLGKTGLFRVSAPFYGQAPESLQGLCPIVASYGGRDKVLHGDAERLQRELPSLGIAYDMKIYPDAGHSFMNRPPNGFVRMLGGIMGTGYNPEAAADAKQRLVRFLGEHL